MAEDVNDQPVDEEEDEEQSSEQQQILDDLTVLSEGETAEDDAERQIRFGGETEEAEDQTQFFGTIHTGSIQTQDEVEAALPPQGQVPIPEGEITTTDEDIDGNSDGEVAPPEDQQEYDDEPNAPSGPAGPGAPPPGAEQQVEEEQAAEDEEPLSGDGGGTGGTEEFFAAAAPAAAPTTAATPTEATTASEPTEPTIVTVPETPTVPLDPVNLDVADSVGLEDTPIPLSITLPGDADPAAASITLSNIPGGAVLTVDGVALDTSSGSVTLSGNQLADLAITPGHDSSLDFILGVSVDLGDGSAAQTADLDVGVAPDADTPTLDLSASIDGVEDAAIDLGAISAQVTDLDGSESITDVTISDIPEGSVITIGGTPVTVTDGSVSVPLDQLGDVAITPPADFSGSFSLTVTATATDTDPDTGATDTAETVGTITVNVDPAADPVELGFGDAAGLEDTAIPLDIQVTPTDPSEEVVSVTLGSIPEGAVLTANGAVIDTASGAVTLTPDQLSDLTITPPEDSDADFTLDVSVVTSDGGVTQTTTGTYDVTVEAVADTPELSTTDAIGVQGTSIGLAIDSAVTDADEALSLTIGNIPDGAVLTSGGQEITVVDGVAQISPEQLSGLAIIPPADFVGSFDLSVTATSADTDPESGNVDTAAVSSSVTVNVASDGSITIGDSSGIEDTAIPLNIIVPDAEGVTTTVTLDNIPEGAVLTADGTVIDTSSGSATLASDQLSNLMITPPEDSDVDMALDVTISQDDGASVEVTTDTLNVTVTADADTPTLDLTESVTGVEDTAIALDVSSALTDVDGSEQLSVTIGDIPDGAMLHSGGSEITVIDGQAQLTPEQLADLTITPPTDFTGSFDLTVTSTATETSNLDQESVTGTITVEVEAEVTEPTLPTDPTTSEDTTAEQPTLTSSSVSGAEDTAIALDISAALTDTDGSETLSITIGDIPAGATFSYLDANGNVQTIDPAGATSITLTPDQLDGLSITPPQDYFGDFNLSVQATSTEQNGGDTETVTQTFGVTVSPVLDNPEIQQQDVTGAEDSRIALELDVTMSPETTVGVDSVIISNIPDGAVLEQAILNEEGEITSYQVIDVENGFATMSRDQLANLFITPPPDFQGDFDLTVTAISEDGGIDVESFTVAVTPAATDFGAEDVAAVEDQVGGIQLDIDAGGNDTVIIDGLPDGAALSAGALNADGSYTVAAVDLENLKLILPEDLAGTFELRVVGENGQEITFTVDVDDIADAPTLDASLAAGDEDTAIPLAIDVGLTDIDGSEAIASITISGVPDGAVLSAGTDNGDGTWSLAPADLEALTITPPEDFNGSIDLVVTAVSEETASGETAASTTTLTVDVGAVNDGPVAADDIAATDEDSAVTIDVLANDTDADGNALTVTEATLADGVDGTAVVNDDGTITFTPGDAFDALAVGETQDVEINYTISDGDGGTSSATATVTVTGTNDGPVAKAESIFAEEDGEPVDGRVEATDVDGDALTFSLVEGPSEGSLTFNADGTYTFDPGDGFQDLGVDESRDVAFTYQVDDGQGGSDTATVTITVTGTNDGPVANDDTLSTDEDQPLTFTAADLLSNDTDLDGDALAIIDFEQPDGGTVVQNDDGSFTFTPDDDFSGTTSFTYTISDGQGGTSTATVALDVGGSADTPELNVSPATGSEDTPIPLAIDASLTDAGETLSVTIDGIPSGAVLTYVDGDGATQTIAVGGTSATLSPDQLNGLAITPPEDSDADFSLTLTATSQDGGDSAAISQQLDVTVDAVADAPTAAAADVSGSEDTAIALDLSAGLTDTDGSESLTLSLSGIPEGAVLTAGGEPLIVVDGAVELTQAQLSTIEITPPEDFTGAFDLTLTAVSTEAEGGDTAVSTQTFTVDVGGVNDGPVAVDDTAATDEDSAVTIDVLANDTDADGNALTVTEATLADGVDGTAVVNDDGTITFTPGDAFDALAVGETQDVEIIYTISDGDGGTSSATATVTVTGTNDGPVAGDDALSGTEDQPITFTAAELLGNDTDVDGDTLTITSFDQPAGGTVTQNEDGSFTFTPDENFSGETAFTYTVSDGEGGTSTATVTMDVEGVADAPAFDVSNAAGFEDTAIALDIDIGLADASETLSITLDGIPNGAVLTYVDGDGATRTIDVDGTSATLTPDQLDGLAITPPEDSNIDFQLTVTATSADGDDTATVGGTIDVDVTGVADAPTLDAAFGEQVDSGGEKSNRGHGNNADGVDDDNPGGGGGGPNPHQEDDGVDEDDGGGGSGGGDDGGSGQAGTETYGLNIASGLSDTDGSESLSLTVSGMPDGATLSAGTANADGTWTLTEADLDGLTITLPANAGDVNLTVTATATENDGDTHSVSQVISLERNIGPEAEADALTAEEDGGAVSVNVLANDSDADGGALELTGATLPEGVAGTVTFDADGTVTYDPGDGFQELGIGESTSFDVTYTISDGQGGTSEAAVTITVEGSNDGPQAQAESIAATEDGGAVTGQLDASDVDGDTLTFSLVEGPGEGVVTVNGDGSYSFDPSDGFQDLAEGETREVTFTYQVDDGVGGTSTAVGTVTVSGTNDGPVANADTLSGAEDRPITFTAAELLGNDADADGDALTITSFDQPAGGTVTQNLDGSFTFMPDENFSGETSFTYTVSDGAGGSSTATVTIDVEGVADAPTIAVADSTGSEDTAIALDIDIGVADASEILTITMDGIPEGAVLASGGEPIMVENGSANLTQDQLETLTITPPEDSNIDFQLTVTATTQDGDDINTVTGTIDVDVTGIADEPSLTATLGDGTATTTGGTETNVSITTANYDAAGSGFTVTARAINSDGSLSEASARHVTTSGGLGVAGGASGPDNQLGYSQEHDVSEELIVDFDNDVSSISFDFARAYADEGGSGAGEQGVYEIYRDGVKVGEGTFEAGDGNEGTVTVSAPDGGGFDRIVFKADDSFSDGSLNGDGSDYLVTSIEFTQVEGGETTVEYPLNISSALADTDGSETLTITVANLPDGAALSAGTQNDDGSWTLASGDLDDLTVLVTGDNAGDSFDFTVTATAKEDDGDTTAVTTTLSAGGVNLDDTAEGAAIEVVDAAGSEDTAIALDIDVTMGDGDGSETLSITISGVPDGAVLSAGTANNDGTWTLTEEDLADLSITPPDDSNEDFTLTITAVTTETASGETSSVSTTLDVEVAGVADAPTLSVDIGEGTTTSNPGTTPVAYWNVDETSGRDLDDQIGGHDGRTHGAGGSGSGSGSGSDHLNLDDSGQFGSAAEFDAKDKQYIQVDHSADLKPDSGTLTMWFNADKVSGSGMFTLASSDSRGYDGGGHFGLYIDDGQLKLAMQGDNDETTIAGGDVDKHEWNQVTVTWGEGGAKIYLNGELVASDPDWTRGLSGNENPWTFGASQSHSGDNTANNLRDFFDGHMDDIALYDQELTDEQVAALFDDGVQEVMASDTGGSDGTVYPVTITTALTDADGSESLSVTITGLPDGATLSAGTDNGDGTWTLVAEDLDDLTITVPTGSDDFNLAVTATATEDDGDTRSVSSTVSVEAPERASISRPDSFDHAGTAGGDTISGGDGVDAIDGGAGNDVIYGDKSWDTGSAAGDDVVFAGDGNDHVEGGGGDDQIAGEAGDDILFGDHDWDTANAGNDTIDGGAGNDTIGGGDGDDHLYGGDGNDLIYGDLSWQTGSGAGDDVIDGGAGNDTIYGGEGADQIDGGAGNDVIYGDLDDANSYDGSDTIDGGGGDDTIYGGAGDDTLAGGEGNDDVYGGDGSDLFIFGAGDGADYFHGGDGWSDTIQLSGVNSGPGGDSGWTLQLDDGASWTETENGIEFGGGVSGKIELADGSELTFEGVEKLEW